jgi:hypothetical protein
MFSLKKVTILHGSVWFSQHFSKKISIHHDFSWYLPWIAETTIFNVKNHHFLQVIVCFTRCLVKRRTGKSGTLKPWRLGSGASDGLMILSFTQGGAQKP